MKEISNCVIIGHNSNALEDYSIIIGDNINGLDHGQKDVMFIGGKVAIGKTIFGKPCNLREIVEGAL